MQKVKGTIVLAFVVLFCSPLAAREWSDATGSYRVEAELVAVRGSKVVLERKDGNIISVAIARLSAADKAFLKKWRDTKTKPIASKAMPAKHETLNDLELADRVTEILQRNCYSCHGEDGSSEGGFNFALDLKKISESLNGDSNDSLLLSRIKADDDSVMPPSGESDRPSRDEINLVEAWIERGMPARPRRTKRRFIESENVVDSILNELKSTPERSQRFMRFFSLVNLYNADVADEELATYRNAFRKLLNSLSWSRDIVLPKSINPTETLFAVDIRNLNWESELWNSLETANPYHVPRFTKSAAECYRRTQTQMPLVRVDWFVHAASQPPLYHEILQLPETDAELETTLHVNVASNIEQEKAIRAGFNRSGVSQHNRMIEWHRSTYGSYWKSYDFGGSVGRQNLFENPMGPGADSGTFRHDGGELIFSLPNGLQGYMLVDGNGGRIDQGPVAIVSDPKRPDRKVTNGVSCMSCHYAGVIPKRDEVGEAVRANRRAYRNADDILSLYRPSKELNEILAQDGQRFVSALEKLGIKNLSRSGESISAMAAQFEDDIDLKYVAAEFGITEQEFRTRVVGASRVTRIYGPLLVNGGTIKRDTLKTTFVDACLDLKLVPDPNSFLFRVGKEIAKSSSKPLADLETLSRALLTRPSSRRPSFERAFPRTVPPREMLPSPRSISNAFPASPPSTPLSQRQSGVGGLRTLGTGQLGTGQLGTGSFPSRSPLPTPSVARTTPTRPSRMPAPTIDVPENNIARFSDISWGFGALAFTPDGKWLLGAHKTDGITVFDIKNQSVMSITKMPQEFNQSSFAQVTPDGRFFLLGSYKGLIAICAINDKGQVRMINQFAGHSSEIKCMSVSADGRYAVSGGRDKAARYWEIRSGRQKALLHSFEREVKAVQISKDGNTAWATDLRTLVTYDLKTQQTVQQRPLSRYGSGQSAAISDDGKYVAIDDGRKIDVWEIDTGRPLPPLDSSEISWAMQFLPDSHILSTGNRAKISFWDVESQTRIAAETFQNATYLKVFAISSDKTMLAANTLRELVARTLKLTD